jgi:hypothetical protein
MEETLYMIYPILPLASPSDTLIQLIEPGCRFLLTKEIFRMERFY